MPKSGVKGKNSTKDGATVSNNATDLPYKYDEVQCDEIEALKAIYETAFTDIEAKSAWSTAADRAFKLKLNAYSDNDVFVIFRVTFTATYPKTLPVLKLEGASHVAQDVLEQVRDVIATKPSQMLGEVMIHELAATIQDTLEDAVAANARKEAEKAQVPSLERERSTQEATNLRLEEERRHKTLRREREARIDEDRVRESKIEEEIQKRELKRVQLRSAAGQDEDASSSNVPHVVFDQHITYRGDTGNTFKFKKVVLIAVLERRQSLSTFLASPVTKEISSSVLLLKRVQVTRQHVKSQVLDLEKSLESVKIIRHANVLALMDFRVEHSHNTWQFDLLTEHSNQGTLAEFLGICDVLPTGKARMFAIEILQGLGYLHRQGIVHRTLTVDNIFLHAVGGAVTVKVANAEFGKYLDQLIPNTSQHVTPSSWEVPEAANSDHSSASRQSDIWEFGVVLVQMLLGLELCETFPNPASFLRSNTLTNAFEDVMDDVFQSQPRNRPSAFDLIPYEWFRVDVPALQPSTNEPSTQSFASRSRPVPQRLRKGSSTANTAESSRYASEWDEIGRLGKGGYGEVVKARNKLDHRVCAIKKIQQKTQVELNQVLSEIHVLARLNNPYVVRYYGAWPEIESEDSHTTSDSMFSGSLSTPNFDHESTSASLDQSAAGLDFISSSGYPKIEFGYDDDDEEGNEHGVKDDHSGSNDSQSSGEPINNGVSRRRSASHPTSRATLYIQMELCDRFTLRDLIRKDLFARKDDVWRIFRYILEGLQHIHSHQIIHRDLKPENIFIDDVGNPRIGDFGLATSGHSVRSEQSADGQCDSGFTSNVGTALYVAPEVQTRSNSSYTAKIDMYSLGIIFFEMCYPLPTAMERLHFLTALRLKEHQLPKFPSTDGALQSLIVEELISHQPSMRPTPAELLQSAKLPVQVEDKTVSQAIKGISDESSPYHQRILSALFSPHGSRDSGASVSSQLWDRSDREATQVPSVTFAVSQRLVKERIIECFERHGAVEISRQGLIPRSDFYENKNAYEVLDASGVILQLPYDLTLPLARMIAKQATVPEKIYTFGTVVRRDAQNNGALRTNREADFDIVTTEAKDSALQEAELIKVLDEIQDQFPSLATASMCFYISHSDLLDNILSFCRVPEAKRPAVKDVLGRLNIQTWTWQKIAADLKTSLGISSTSLDDLARFDFRDQPEKALSHLQSIMGGTQHISQLHEVFVHLTGVIEYCKRLGVHRQIYISPLSSFNDRFYRGGTTFQSIFDNKKRDVLAAGGRYDHLIEAHHFQGKKSDTQLRRHGVGIAIAWDRIVSSMVRHESRVSCNTGFLKKGEDALRLPLRRCDILVACFDAETLRSAGVRLVSRLWSSGISAELAADCTSQEELLLQERDGGHGWIVIIRHENSKFDLRVKNLDRNQDEDVQSSSLVPFLRTQIRERDQHEGAARLRIRQQQDDAADDTNDNIEVHVLVASTKTKKSNKMRIVESARLAAQNLVKSFGGAPIAAIETRDDIFGKLQGTRLSDADSWRKVIQEAPLNEREYVREVQEEIEDLKRSYGETNKNCFLYNFRTGACIYYDMTL